MEVTGKGYHHKPSERMRKIDGQIVRIVENGEKAPTTRSSSPRRRGHVRFRPASGKKGKRRLFALIEHLGMPRDRVRVGTYTAPGTQRPSKPRFVRLTRRNGKLVVTWGRSRGAAEYAVRAKLRDGRRIVIPTKKRKHTIANVPGIDSGKISVYGIAKDGITFGKPAKAGFKAKPKKLKKKRRR